VIFILVVSTKGGVGKSTIAAALASTLAKNLTVGLIDLDLTNPSIPKLTGVEDEEVEVGETIKPVEKEGLRIVSIQMFLGKTTPIIWEGMYTGLVTGQMLSAIDWKGIDVFIVDTPPGTSDELLTILNMFPKNTSAVVITGPQELSVDNVRRGIALCQDRGIPVIGLIENMSFFKCPKCNEIIQLGNDAAKKLATEMGVPYLGEIPFDPKIMKEGDKGLMDTISRMEAFKKLIGAVGGVLAGGDKGE